MTTLHAHTKQHNRRPWKKNHEFQIEKLLDCEENVLLTLADKLHLFPLEFCWKLGDGFSLRAPCKKFMHFYESSRSWSFLTVNLPDAKSSSTCVVPTVSLCSLAWYIVNLLNSLSPFYPPHLLLLDCFNYPKEIKNQPTCRLKNFYLNLILTCNIYWIRLGDL